MKLKKFLGNLLAGLGCIVMLIGLAGFILPRIDNRQLKLVLSSFDTPSDNWLIQLMNNGMNFAMDHSLLMLLIGMAVMAFGFLLAISARTDAQVQQKSAIVRTAAVSAVPVTAATLHAASHPEASEQPRGAESNPFARYMTDSSLPKSTTTSEAVQSDTSRVTAKHESEPQQHEETGDAENCRDDILNIWNNIQQQPQDSSELFIQPVHVEDDEAYRRPEDVAAQPADPAEPQPEPANEASQFFPLEEEQAAETADEPESPAIPAATVPLAPAGRDVPPAAPAAADKPRPVIRSTFRKSTVDQPVSEPDAPAEDTIPETMPESAVEAPAMQPASRIKSTMGRKR